MIHDAGGASAVSSVAPPLSAVWAFSLGIDQHWPLILGGVIVGLMAKAAATLSAGRPFGWRELRIDLLMALFLFVVAGFVVDMWTSVIAVKLSPFGIILLSSGLSIGGARVRSLVAHWAVGSAAKALGVTGSTSDVVLPPAGPGPEASALLRALDKTPGHE